MVATTAVSGISDMIRQLDRAVALADDELRCREVKRVLQDVVRREVDLLPAPFLQPVADTYARRLLHRDPEGRYSVLVMVWNLGQATPLHDHGGHWCVECVYRGRIRVTSFSINGGDAERGIVHFKEETQVLAGPGEAGALIPPFEYHALENAGNEPAVTIHVYSEDLLSCHVFEPVEGGWRRRFRQLSLHE